MPTPFQFDRLQQSTKILIVTATIFLLTLTLGLLAFGGGPETATNILNAESLHHGKDFSHLAP